jgi:hypothetical protein
MWSEWTQTGSEQVARRAWNGGANKETPAFDGFERIDYRRPIMTETEVNNLKNMCKTDPHLKEFVTEVTDEKQGASNQFRVTIATKKGARVVHLWSEFQQWRLGLAKIVT